jgi:hypothetical protein
VWQGVGDLARSKWKKSIVAGDATYTSAVAYDEGAKRLICLGFNPGGFQTQIYDPVANKVVAYGSGLNAPYGDWAGDFPQGFQYVPELKGCLLLRGMPEKFVTAHKLNATTGTWEIVPRNGDRPPARSAMGLSYDRKNHVVVLFGGVTRSEKGTPVRSDLWIYHPDRNIWNEEKPAGMPRYNGKYDPNAPADCQMLAYDEEHNVHVLILQEWGDDSGIWAYRYKR